MSKRTIPRLAIATLALGGACSDSGGGNKQSAKALEPAGENATQARSDDVAEAVCRKYNECGPDDFRAEYTTVAECAQGLGDYLDDLGKGDKACKDAVLDYYGCIAKLSCKAIGSEDEDEAGACYSLYVKADELCDFESESTDDEDYDYEDYDYGEDY